MTINLDEIAPKTCPLYNEQVKRCRVEEGGDTCDRYTNYFLCPIINEIVSFMKKKIAEDMKTTKKKKYIESI